MFCFPGSLSLSARRAWIEIREAPPHKTHKSVALRKESVDRNSEINTRGSVKMQSLSARRAWIEIKLGNVLRGCVASLSARRAWIEIDFEGKLDADIWVALRKESVDRNI